MGVAGRSSEERKRLQTSLRGRDVERVLRAAKWAGMVGELTLVDAAMVSTFMAQQEPDAERTSRACARLAARLILALQLDLDGADAVFDLVANLPSDDRLVQLVRYCERADAARAATAA